MTLPPTPVLATLAAIGGLLMVATLAAVVLARRHPHHEPTNLQLRVRTWWQMVSVFAAALLVGRTVSILFFALLSFLALKEYFSLIPIRRVDRRVLFWAYLAIPFQYLWVSWEWYGMFRPGLHSGVLLPAAGALLPGVGDRAERALHWSGDRRRCLAELERGSPAWPPNSCVRSGSEGRASLSWA